MKYFWLVMGNHACQTYVATCTKHRAPEIRAPFRHCDITETDGGCRLFALSFLWFCDQVDFVTSYLWSTLATVLTSVIRYSTVWKHKMQNVTSCETVTQAFILSYCVLRFTRVLYGFFYTLCGYGLPRLSESFSVEISDSRGCKYEGGCTDF